MHLGRAECQRQREAKDWLPEFSKASKLSGVSDSPSVPGCCCISTWEPLVVHLHFLEDSNHIFRQHWARCGRLHVESPTTCCQKAMRVRLTDELPFPLHIAPYLTVALGLECVLSHMRG